MSSVISVLAKLKADTGSYISGMKQAGQATEKFAKIAAQGAKKAEGETGGAFKQMKDGALSMGTVVKGAIVGLLAVQGVNFLKGAIQNASNFQAEFEGVNQTFGSGAGIVQEFAKNAAQTAGLAENTALRFAKSFGGYATSAGLAGDAQAKFSTQMVQAAGDLGSFFDLPTESALMAIQQGLRGEYEPLRRFNILIDEATIGQKAMSMGISKTGKDLTQQQKILARQQIIMDGLGVANGDFVKYAGDYGNAVKTVSALFQNMQTEVGTVLLPSLAKLAQAVMPVITALGPVLAGVVEKLVPIIEMVAKVIEKLIPAVQPVLDILGIFAEVIVDILDVALDPLIELIQVIAPIMKIIAELFQAVLKPLIILLKPLLELLNMVMIPILKVLQFVIEAITAAFDAFGKAVQWVWDNLLAPIWDAIVDAYNEISKAFEEVFGIDMQELFRIFGQVMKEVFTKYIKPALEAIIEGVKVLVAGIKDGATRTANFIRNVARGLQALGLIKIRPHFDTEAIEAGYDRIAAAQIGGQHSTYELEGTPLVPDPDPKPIAAFYQKIIDEIKTQKARVKMASMGVNSDIAEAILSSGKGWEGVYKNLVKGGTKAIKNLESRWVQTAGFLAKIGDTVKSTMEGIQTSIMNGFDVTKMGKSSKAIMSSARKMVEKAKKFGAEIVKLSEMGLNPTLLNQVIAAGPDEGMAVAKALQGTDITELNSLYNQLGTTAMETGGAVAQNQVQYNINVNGGIGDKNTIGKSIVEAIKAYERTNSSGWRTA